jgi:hypothetical protein
VAAEEGEGVASFQYCTETKNDKIPMVNQMGAMVGKTIMRRSIFTVLFVLSVGIYPGWGFAVTKVWVTDVTPRAFSLVWVANQGASCSAKVYADPEGQQPMTGLSVTSDSANHPPAEQNGVMKVNVTCLAPGTTYYFQTVTVGPGGTVFEPATGPLPSVRTEVSSSVIKNDVLAHKILKSDRSTPAQGALLVAEVEGGSYPITGWVGSGAPVPWVLVDLNNIYSKTAHRNLELSGGEAITLESVGGLMGFRRLVGAVPEEIESEAVRIRVLSPPPSSDQCALIMEVLRPKGLRIGNR